MSVCCCPGSNSVHIQGMMITLPSYFFGVHITDLATVAAVHLRCRGVANHDRLGHLRHDRLACQGLNLRKTDLVVLSLLLQLFNKHSWRGRFLCFVVFLCVIQDNEFDNNRARLNSCHQHLVLRAVVTLKALLAEACAIVASTMIGAVFGTNARTAVIRSPADIAFANTSGALPIATAGIFACNLAATWACPRWAAFAGTI